MLGGNPIGLWEIASGNKLWQKTENYQGTTLSPDSLLVLQELTASQMRLWMFGMRTPAGWQIGYFFQVKMQFTHLQFRQTTNWLW